MIAFTVIEEFDKVVLSRCSFLFWRLLNLKKCCNQVYQIKLFQEYGGSHDACYSLFSPLYVGKLTKMKHMQSGNSQYFLHCFRSKTKLGQIVHFIQSQLLLTSPFLKCSMFQLWTIRLSI